MTEEIKSERERTVLCIVSYLVSQGEETRQILGGSIHHSFVRFTMSATLKHTNSELASETLNSDASISDVVHSQMCTSIHLVLRGEKTRQILGGSIHHSFMIFTVFACDIVHADKCCCQVWTNIDTLGNASVLVSTFIQKDAVYMIRFSCM